MTRVADNFDNDDAAIEALLRSAMPARPEPFAPTNLASRAMDLARSAMADTARRKAMFLARQRRWAQWSAIAATLLIAGLLAVAVSRIHSRGDLAYLLSSTSSSSTDSTSTTTATSTSTDASDDSTSSTSSATEATYLGLSSTAIVVSLAGFLVVGMALMTLSRGATPDSWGPDAAAGVW